MAHKLTICETEVEIEWTMATARRYSFRSSKHGIKPNFQAFSDREKAPSAYVECLWLLLPSVEFSKYATPEDLAATIDHEKDSESIVAAVIGCVSEMVTSAEKKSSLKNGDSSASS